MNKYIYKDIIIDPTSEEARNCVGKEAYFADNPSRCLRLANNSCNDYCRILREIKTDTSFPFVLGNQGTGCACIIPKKEKPESEYKDYVPFTSELEFIDKCDDVHGNLLDFNLDYAFLSYRGIWLKDKITEEIKLVSGITKDGLYVNGNYVKWENLLSDYIFLDDSPCGRPKEYKHESNSFLHQFF